MTKKLEFTGNFLFYDKKNLNGRIYPKKVAEEIIKEQDHKSKSHNILGQFGYPTEENFGEISLCKASHIIKEIHLDENDQSIKGTIQLLDTSMGKKVKELLDEQTGKLVRISCRSRGYGNINEEGEIENFKIISFDLVKGPDGFANIKEDDFQN